MPVVGFHQARRPRQTTGDRMRRELSWPRPGGIIISVVGAALVFGGSLTISPSADSGTSVSSAPAPSPNMRPAASQAPTLSSATPTELGTQVPTSAPATLSASGLSASPLAPATTAPAPAIAGATADSPIQKLFAAATVTPTEKALRDITNPNSPLVLVNKQRPLVPANYSPSDLVAPKILSGSGEPVLLRAEAATAAERMFAAAAAQGFTITVKSSYRSYETQVSVYNGYVAGKGEAAADSTSARPGFSEHQSGLALDIGDADAGTACDFNSCFEDAPAAQWVATHGSEFGFLVRYQSGDESITGYLAEPWHLRYVGTGVAQDMQALGISSYEKYLGVPDAPGYK
ncbi:M15 family metallopeptidase [Arthrobacter alpinus]|uniref:M15 family metallopeptidase n=1 Tax=Arthrobacter alpinus TaxID=656366 RepID=UPI000AD07FDA|nr:M15 family metallopeptidase [Arthrobacter alpinus]